MLRWLLLRLGWSLVTLFGITVLTFCVVDRAPVDRAEIEIAANDHLFPDRAAKAAAIQQRRVDYGKLDPITLEPVSVWQRYGIWLGNAARLRFGNSEGEHGVIRDRLIAALPITAWLGGLALVVALAVGLLLGAWLGLRAGSRLDRGVSVVLLAVVGVPEFLLGTLALLGLGVWLGWFPISGLRSPDSDRWMAGWQLLDFGWHLVLPVAVMAAAPLAMIARFVRDSVAKLRDAPFVAGLRALGMPEHRVRWRVLRHGAVPVATLLGSLLSMLVSGSIVVENLFALDGLGHLTLQALQVQDQPMLMAIVVLSAVATLLALLLSDVVHRLVDGRVRLGT
jgi:peptide/nickel transport system permease protein